MALFAKPLEHGLMIRSCCFIALAAHGRWRYLIDGAICICEKTNMLYYARLSPDIVSYYKHCDALITSLDGFILRPMGEGRGNRQ
jgi:hypothetical protein